MRKIFSICLIIFILTVSISTVLAHSPEQIPTVSQSEVLEASHKFVPIRFLPSHPLYFSIILKEKFTRLMKPSSVRRADFDLTLSGKRLNEAYLLSLKGDYKNTSKSLKRYAESNQALLSELLEAKEQNEDMKNLIGQTGDLLGQHEIILLELGTKSQTDDYNFKASWGSAFESFEEMVVLIDSLNPGIKNRFRSLKDEAVTPAKEEL